MALIRLDRYLAESRIGTRSEVKRLIRAGLIQVDSQVITRPEYKLDAQQARVFAEGKPVSYCEKEYYLLNKPQGVVSATVDSVHPTVVDFIPSRRRDLFPVGRLDIDTEGLLLITNDGALCHRLLAPGKHVDKRYYAVVEGAVTQADVAACQNGIEIGTQNQPERTRPAHLTMVSTGAFYQLPEAVREKLCMSGSEETEKVENLFSQIYITLQEGRYHQVKRMFARLGKPVRYLKRVSMGTLVLDETLAPGQYRPLTKDEIQKLSGKSTSDSE